MKWISKLQQLPVAVIFTVCAGLMVTGQVYAALPQTAAVAKAQVTVQSVQVLGEGDATTLLVTTSAPVTYTSYRTTAPERLVVDLSQAVTAAGLPADLPAQGAFKRVSIKRFDTDAGTLTRLEIELQQPVDAIITPVVDKPNSLQIAFPGYASKTADVATAPQPALSVEQPAAQVAVPKPQPVVPEAAAAEVTVTGVFAQAGKIQIRTVGGAPEYKSFRLAWPERVVIDLAGAKAAPDLKIVQLNTAGIATARVGSYADKVRIVLDALTGDLPDASIEKNADGLMVGFERGTTTVQAPAAKQESPAAAAAPVKAAAVAQVEAVDFQAFEKLSRVTVKVAGTVKAEQPVRSAGFVTLRLHNVQLPKHLQRSYEAREFASPVLRVTPIQVATRQGEDTIIRVAMRAEAEFAMRREADLLYLEFKHPAAPAATAVVASAPKAAATESAVEQQLSQPAASGSKRSYTGRKVTLEFADAEVRKIFQLLSEVSNKNFVLGDEVSGAISLKLVNVPWDQALDIILDTKGLDKREEGNIILIRGKGKFKSLLDEEEEIRKATLKNEPLETAMFDVNYADIAGIVTQFNALKSDRGMITSDARTNKIIVKDVKTALDDMRKLLTSLDVPERQVMIEARIVEASTDFVHSLGINWFMNTAGKNPLSRTDQQTDPPFLIDSSQSSFGGLAATAAAIGVPGFNSDILFGTIGRNTNVSMRINAAASAGLVKIISTPKVATLNHKSAKITQGQQIPYTSATSDKVETKFVEAALSLEVTPHINANGTIVMKIDAKNDAPGATGNPPAINKKQATTEMLLRDGETTVIGGIYVDSETEGEQGVPWLKDIPLLGYLFKSKDTRKNRSELLIFITPRILNQTI